MKRQLGFTMVEILLALTLSLLLIVGVSELFMGNRDTYRVQAGMGTLQETARFATETIRREINMAGYMTTDGFAIDAANTVESPTNTPDVLAVRYMSERSCTGVAQVATIETHTYSIVRNPVTSVSTLRCNGAPLIDGVENMQFLYGYDTDGDSIPNQYVRASGLAGAEWSKVVAVRFALLINSSDNVSREPDLTKFVLLDAPEIQGANDLLRRRIYFGTAVIRNKATQS